MIAPRKIAVIGVGLIGGSLCLAIKRRWPGVKVVGYHRDLDRLKQALKLRVIDEATDDLNGLCAGADFIFICTPVSNIIDQVKAIRPHLNDGTIVTDVGSTKRSIVYDAERLLAGKADFIGGHPLAGSEQKGVLGASASLFQSAIYILTPTPNTSPAAFQRLHGLLTQLGARIVALSPEKHDQVVAIVSHLPHLLAASLINLAARSAKETENILFFAAGGFRDMTRIAAGDPDLWVDISLENKEAILQALDDFISELSSLRRVLDKSDAAELLNDLAQAKELRQSLSLARPAEIKLREIEIPVTDTPGVISKVTLAFGRVGINIEDIQIIHISENSGIIRLLVSESPNLDQALAALKEEGFDGIKLGKKTSR